MKGLDSHSRITSNNVLIIAVVLCQGFLKNHTPERFVNTLLCKRHIVCAKACSCLESDIVVHNNSVWDAEGIDVDCIDTLRVCSLVKRIQEDFFHTTSLLSNGGHCGNHPAVADLALNHVLGSDTFTSN